MQLGFERLADLNRQIKELSTKKEKILKYRQETRNFEETNDLLKDIKSKLEKLERERKELKALMVQNHEPLEDPRETIRRKYELMKQRNKRIKLLKEIINDISVLQGKLAVFHNTQIAAPYAAGDGQTLHMIEILKNAQYNYEHMLRYQLKPVTDKDFKKEMAEAEALVEKLRKKAEKQAEIKQEIESILS